MKKILCTIIFSLLILLPFNSLKAQLKNPKNLEYEWKTDTANRITDLSEITMVLPRHSFPAIDYPAFIGKAEGLSSFFKHEPVISVAINGEAKAYPLNMLTMHEISNGNMVAAVGRTWSCRRTSRR